MRTTKLVAVVSAAMVLLLGMSVHAAGLGKLNVQSALGQPLNADIEVLLADPSEFRNLHAQLASPDAFRSANVEMASSLQGLHFKLIQRADGGTVLHLTSNNPIRDPFLDLIIELDWSGGQMMREYTLLLDPPGLAAQEHAQSMVVSPAVGASSLPAGANTSAPMTSVEPWSDVSAQHGSLSSSREVGESPAKPRNAITGNSGSGTVKVKPGMTLSQIAEQHLPEDVVLDQMLVGLYHTNPHAFDGNMNRLKAGVVLRLPDSSALQSVTPAEATREVHAQTQNWDAYRQKVALAAESGAAKHVQGASTAGKVTSGVEDKSAAPVEAGKDVLKLSKSAAPAGTVGGEGGKLASQDERAAQQKSLEEAHVREQLLQKNIQDMQKLLALKQQQQAQATIPPAPAAIPATPATQSPVMPPMHPPIKHHSIKLIPPPAPPAPKWYEMINPLYLGAGAGAILLATLALAMRRSRNKKEKLENFENSILTSTETKPDAVNNTQGGESVNTGSTSFLTDFSQSGLGTLDAHDVDPIAEAEVYMAYGRDAQAEEILREALLKEPNRHEIKLKLLEIYAGRNNLPAFESIATELHLAAGAESDIWQKAAEMGRRIDPHNPLYGGLTAEAGMSMSEEPAANLPTAMMLDDDLPVEEKLSGMIDFDMNALHQSPTHEVEASVDAAPVQSTGATTGLPADADLSWDFEVITEDEQPVAATHQSDPHVVMDFELPDVMAHQETTALLQPEVNDAATASDAVAGADFANDAIDQSGHLPEIEAIEIYAPEALPDEYLPSMESTFAHQQSTDQQSTDQQLTDQQLTDQQPTDQQTSVQQSADLSGHDMPVALDFSDINLDFDEPAPSDQQAETEDHAAQTQALPDSGVALSEAQQEVRTKFELALVYQEMGDLENASEILQEVIAEGDEQQKKDAMALLEQMKE